MNEKRLAKLCLQRDREFLTFLRDFGLDTNYTFNCQVGDIQEFPEKRNVAYTAKTGKKSCDIVFAPKWHLTENNYDAVLRHEFAHALEFVHPNIFQVLRKNGLFFNEECHEIYADKLAELIFGDRIYYDENLIQTLDKCAITCRPYHLGW